MLDSTVYCLTKTQPGERPLLLFGVLLGLVDALADTGFVTLAAGAFFRLGVLLAHG